MRRPFIAGNWKMYLNKGKAEDLVKDLVEGIHNEGISNEGTSNIKDRDILVCPPYPLLPYVSEIIKNSSIQLGAQNMYFEREGAFTGEVSGDMLLSVGCSYVILGHSERRHKFGEDDELINKKLHSALEQGLRPILCVGELLEERESGKTKDIVGSQVEKGLKNIGVHDMSKITVAYEPVWAIGTGKTATPDDADTVHSYIREILNGKFNSQIAEVTRILYGGSVKPENVDGLMGKENIDGALVGGASLKAESFLRIIAYSADV